MTSGMRTIRLGAAAMLATMVGWACTGAAMEDEGSTGLRRLTAGEPTLEIGVVEGDDAYTFASVDGVLRLPDGSIAVSDAGSTRISVYDRAGTFLRSWGTRGEGPGEFRSLSRIYRHGRDSLMAADNATGTLSVFDLNGAYGRQLPGLELSQDSTFRLDSWLYGRFWIEGALGAADRAEVKAAIDRLPPPRDAPGYRRGLVTPGNAMWIHDADVPAASDDAMELTRWIVIHPTGLAVSTLDLPARFTPMDISGDEVLGSWLGPADVSFVRAYPIQETEETGPAPAWLEGSTGPVAGDPGPSDDEFRALMRESIRGMARAQEIHYSSNMTYTTDVESLDFDAPDGLGVSFTHAHPRGWAAVFTHPSADRICGLAYGAGTPPGWQAGGIVCGPPSAPSPAPGA